MRKLLNKKFTILIVLFFIMIILFIFSLFVGSSKISFSESLNALFGNGQKNHIIIMQNIRIWIRSEWNKRKNACLQYFQ